MEWQPIATAPRDGTSVILTSMDMDSGKPQEICHGMIWNQFAGNEMVQSGKGIWAMHSATGQILMTWSEEGGYGPTHWKPYPQK